MRSEFLNVFRSKNENLEKKRFRTFFCLGGHFDQPQKFRVALARNCTDVRRVLSRGGWSKLQCVLVCVWRFYFGGARIGSKQPHSKEYPSTS